MHVHGSVPLHLILTTYSFQTGQYGSMCKLIFSMYTLTISNVSSLILSVYRNNTNRGYVEPLEQEYSFGTAAEEIIAYPDTVWLIVFLSYLFIVCFVYNITKYTRVQIAAWPGQKISMVITGLDQFNHSTIANAGFTKPNSGTRVRIWFVNHFCHVYNTTVACSITNCHNYNEKYYNIISFDRL